MREFFREIKGYNKKYYVSNLGRVLSKNLITPKIMSLTKNKKGYLRVTLSKNGKSKSYLVHRLVAEAFKIKGVYKESFQVDHIDRNPSNNRLNNLRCIPQKINSTRDRKGYYFDKQHKKFRVRTRHNGVQKHIGYFNTELEAKEAYDSLRKNF